MAESEFPTRCRGSYSERCTVAEEAILKGARSSTRTGASAPRSLGFGTDLSGHRSEHRDVFVLRTALSCGASAVIAVEPIPLLAQELRRVLGRRGVVREVALSSYEGMQTLIIPSIDGTARLTRATLLADGMIEGTPVDVRTIRCDQLNLPQNAVIKIDVEGHEMDVLRGAEQLLRARVPAALLVESEERHTRGGPADLIRHLTNSGYRGWAVQSDNLIPASRFDAAVHQSDAAIAMIESGDRRPSDYANNFCFVREDLAASFVGLLGEAGFVLAEES